ncbi:MAG: ABC transporter substrate-binding protein [Gaiellaceae bacterium]
MKDLSRRQLVQRGLTGVGVLAIPGVIAACGGDDSAAPAPADPAPAEPDAPAPPPAEPDAPAPAPAETAEEPPAPEPEPEPEETRTSLIVLQPTAAEALDWDGTQASSSATQELISQVYRPLIDYEWVKNGDILEPQFTSLVPSLAESWEQDGLEWTFNLKQGLLSPAGNELTADDVVWTFARAKSIGGSFPCAWFLANVSSILTGDVFVEGANLELEGEVEAIDSHTVKFTQFETNEVWPGPLAVFCLLIIDSTAAMELATDDDPFAFEALNNTTSAGFGWYDIESWEKGTEVVLAANENTIDEVEFTDITIRAVSSSATRIGALLSGDADIVTGLSPQEFEEVGQEDNVKVLNWQGNLFLTMGLNYSIAPWDGGGDPQVQRLLRQAVAHAIPYDNLINDVFFGQAKKWDATITTGFVGAIEFPGRYTQDLELAASLLADAGFPDGEGLDGDGMLLHYIAEQQSRFEPAANFIRSALAEIGVQIELGPIPAAEFATRHSTTWDMPMFFNENTSIDADTGYFTQLYYLPADAGGLVNASNYNSPEVVELFNQQRTATGQERADIQAEMQALLIEDLPQIPLVEPAVQIAMRADLTDWQPRLERAMTMATLRNA